MTFLGNRHVDVVIESVAFLSLMFLHENINLHIDLKEIAV